MFRNHCSKMNTGFQKERTKLERPPWRQTPVSLNIIKCSTQAPKLEPFKPICMHSSYFYENRILSLESLLTHSDVQSRK